MPMTRHHNYRSEKGEVYCCLRNRIVPLDAEQLSNFCSGCRMFAGDLNGSGVSCDWDDSADVADPHLAFDPRIEFKRNQIKQVPPEGLAALQSCS
jgi:hypothetical protein